MLDHGTENDARPGLISELSESRDGRGNLSPFL
jgi:hypothetical protein